MYTYFKFLICFHTWSDDAMTENLENGKIMHISLRATNQIGAHKTLLQALHARKIGKNSFTKY